MTDARARLLATLTACAEHGRPCPSLPQLGQAMRVSTTTVSKLLLELRDAGAIRWRLKTVPHFGMYRIVTIAATGKSTGEPVPPKRKRKGAAPEPAPYQPIPSALTSPGRVLAGKELALRKRELEAREAADAERRRGGS